ncbi:MAG: leucine-rich repeat protein [Paludibacteraceae bacterium]|nr:leucine-rich repeat protein [Paludibacteraceae bacterium]
MKKFFLFFIALSAGVMSVHAKTKVDGIWYILNDSNSTATVTYGEEDGTYAGRLIIPGSFYTQDENYNYYEFTVTAIGDSAFRNCPNLTGITIPGSVENIGSAITFGSDYIAEVKFEDSSTPIAMSESSFIGATPNSCTYLYLGRNVADNGGVPPFHTWSSIQNVVIGEKVTELPLAFCPYCRGLKSVQINTASLLEPGPRTFAFLDEDRPQPDASQIILYVPEGLGNTYQAHTFWGRFNIQEMDQMKQYGIQFASNYVDFYQNGLYYQVWQDQNNPDYKYLAVVIPQVWYLNPDGTYVSQWSSEFPYKQSSVTIPDSVTFYHWYDGRTDRYSGRQESGVYEPLTYKVEAIGDYCFRGAENLSSLYIPNTVKFIGTEAFEYTKKLHYLTIPNSVKEVGWLAFARTGLKEIVIPASSSNWLENNAAFQENENLTKATFASGTTAIQDRIFFGCTALRTIIIPDEVMYIGPGAFAGCEALTEIHLPASLQVLNNRLFRGCPLRSLEIPAGVIEIEGSALLGTNIAKLTVNPANTVFDSRDNCNAIIRTADNTLVAATNGAFIPATVDSIAQESFNELNGIRSLTLPANLKHVSEYGFMNLENLTLITSNIQNPAGVLEQDAFENWYGNTYATATLYIPAGTLAAYRADEKWNRFQNIVEMTPENKPASVEDIAPIAESGTASMANLPANTDLTNAVVGNLYLTCDTTNGDHYDAMEQALVLNTVVDEMMIENILANPDNSDVIRNNFSGMIVELPAGQVTISITVKTEGDHLLAVQIGNGDSFQDFVQLVKGVIEVNYDIEAAARAYIFGFIPEPELPAAAPTKHMPRHSKADWITEDVEDASTGSVAIYGISWNIEETSAIDEISQETKNNSQKLIRDGQILIIRDGRTFNTLGIEIK